jgi:hypothetical protein
MYNQTKKEYEMKSTILQQKVERALSIMIFAKNVIRNKNKDT